MTATKQRTKTAAAPDLPSLPIEIAMLFRWDSHPNATGELRLQSATFTTKWYYKPDRAIAEALRWVGSQPTVEAIDGAARSGLPSDDVIAVAAAMLRARGMTVRPHGLKWLIKQTTDTHQGVLTLSPEDLVLAGDLVCEAGDTVTLDALRDKLYERTGEPRPISGADDLPPGGWGYHTLPIADIRRDGGTQARVGLNEDTVKEYTEAMREGLWDWLGTRSRPIVCWDDEGYWLADGFHRIEAAQRAGRKDYPVEVLRGGKRAALLRAAGANVQHGLRRTNADKRRAVELLLRDEEWRQWSDRKIAETCGVSNKFVGDMRRDLGVYDTHLAPRIGADGKSYPVAPAAKPAAPVDMIDRTPRETPRDLKQAGLALFLDRGGWIIISQSNGLSLTPTARRTSDAAIEWARANLMPPHPDSAAAEQLAAQTPDLIVGQRADPNKPDPKEPPPATGDDHKIVATIREKAAALGLEMIWEDDEVLLYWPDEIDDLEQMDGLSYDAAFEWLENEAPGIAAYRAERDTTAPAPKPLCACGKPSTTHENIGGTIEWRCQACAIRAECDDLTLQLGDQYRGVATDRGDPLDGRAHRIHWATGGGGDYTYAEVLERIAAGRAKRPTTTDPVAAAQSFLDKARAALQHWDNSALPSRREYEAALGHIAALLGVLEQR